MLATGGGGSSVDLCRLPISVEQAARLTEDKALDIEIEAVRGDLDFYRRFFSEGIAQEAVVIL